MIDFGCLARDKNLVLVFSMAIPFFVQTTASVSVLKLRKGLSILLKFLFWLYPSEREYRNASIVAVLSELSLAICISKFSVFTFVPVSRSYHSHWTPNRIYCEVLVSYFTRSLSPTELIALELIESLHFAAGDTVLCPAVCKFGVYVLISSITFDAE